MFNRNKVLFLLSMVLFAFVVVPSAGAITLTCGDTVVLGGGKVVLDNDLDCGSGRALTVVGPGTFNMDGHTVAGEGAGPVNPVLAVEGHKAKVSNGVVDGKDVAVTCIGTSQTSGRFPKSLHLLDGLVVTHCAQGFSLGDYVTVKNSTAIENSIDGFAFNGGGLNTDFTNVLNCSAINNGTHGFSVSGIKNKLRDNLAAGNGVHGFFIGAAYASESHTIAGNTAVSNGEWGIYNGAGTDQSLNNNQALNNGTGDLYDDLADCDANKWRNNVFGTANQVCIE